MKYKTILADPPWQQTMTGKYKAVKNQRPERIPYPTMSVDEIARLPIGDFAELDCHLWLWTTNQFIEAGFRVMRAWGFKYLAPIHWVKPSGTGNYFVHRTQTVLFGYRQRCVFPLRRYAQNVLEIRANPKRHSEKPDATYEYIEAISPGPRLELFARRRRPGWDIWGNEVESDIQVRISPLNLDKPLRKTHNSAYATGCTASQNEPVNANGCLDIPTWPHERL